MNIIFVKIESKVDLSFDEIEMLLKAGTYCEDDVVVTKLTGIDIDEQINILTAKVNDSINQTTDYIKQINILIKLKSK